MITEAKIPCPPSAETSLKLFLENILEWLIDNPPWLVGIFAVIALLLWYFLHFRPAMKQEQRNSDRLAAIEMDRISREKADNEAKLQRQISDRKRKEDERLANEQKSKAAKEAKRKEDERLANEQKSKAAKEAKRLEDEAIQKQAGTDFELRVVELIKEGLVEWFDTGRAKLLFDVNLPHSYTNTDDGNPQIDVLIIDISGIYIVECKCWKGLMVGKYNWAYWLKIQCDIINGFCPLKEKGEPFYCKSIESPLLQNNIHEKELSAHLVASLPKGFNQFKKVTVFSKCGNIDFIIQQEPKPGDFKSQFTWLGMENELIATIKHYDMITPKGSRLSMQDVRSIHGELSKFAGSL